MATFRNIVKAPKMDCQSENVLLNFVAVKLQDVYQHLIYVIMGFGKG